MAVKIDSDVCGHIENCPVQGLCIKLCEQGAIIEEDGMIVIYASRIVLTKLFLKHKGIIKCLM